MTQSVIEEVVLTSEQRHRLGQVYRLILGWRKQRKTNQEKLNQPAQTERNSMPEPGLSDSASPIESES
jgi:hypothetical protein